MTATQNPEISLSKAAFIAGIGILMMALTVPVVEFYIFPKLIDYDNTAQTANNINNHKTLFSTAIFIHFISVVCDVIVAWALYIFLTPVNKNLALLAAWLRLVYAGFNITALLNLIKITAVLKASENFSSIQNNQVFDYVMLCLNSFNFQWRFGLVFFGIYMLFLGYLTLKASYIPKVIGAFLIIAALGYLIDDLKYFFYPNFHTGFLWFTFFGELIFMFWLLIKGSRLRNSEK